MNPKESVDLSLKSRDEATVRHQICVRAIVPLTVGSLTATSKTQSEQVGLQEYGRSGAANAAEGSRTVTAAEAFSKMLMPAPVRLVEAQRTPITASVAKEAIGRAYAALTGQPLDASGQAILTAQWAHETGHGASMYNYNFGGIKGTGPSGLSVSQRTREGYGASERQIVDQFRAYSSVDEGAKDYVRLLLNRYGAAVGAAQQGDAAGFVRGLKQKGYFTGDPVAYERNIKAIAHRLGGTDATNDGAVSNHQWVSRADPFTVTSRSVSNFDGALKDQALLSRMQGELALFAAPQPTALLDTTASDGVSSGPLDGSTEGFSAVRALSMADEITRSVLEIAKEDADRRRIGRQDD